MKKISKLFTIISSVLCLCMAFALTSCKGTIVQQTETAVVFEAKSSILQITETTTLKDYVDVLVTKEEITIEGTESSYGYYITSINGKTAASNESWLIYTNDTANSNADWGTYDYNGTTLGSATLGISSLTVVEGCYYAFVLSSF